MPMQPASTNKVLTTAAALLTPGPRRPAHHDGGRPIRPQPGVVVLDGGGDPTLSAAPPGQDTWYRDAARISDLADQVRRSGITVTAVQVDVSAFSGPTMAPGWDPLDIDGGDIAPMESVMLDGGRTQPVSVDSARSRTPALDAGRALAVALRVDPATVTLLPPAVRRATADRVGAVAAADRAAARDDERLRQRDGRVDRPGGGRRARAAAELRRRGRRGARRAGLRRDRHRGAHLMDSSGLSVDDRLTARDARRDRQRRRRARPADAASAGGPVARSPAAAARCRTGSSTPMPDASSAGLAARQDRVADRHQLAGRDRHRCQRPGADLRASSPTTPGPTGRTAIDALAATLRSCGCGT